MRIEENIPLASLTTLGVGGRARWLVRAGSEDEIVEAARWAAGRTVPLFVLGGGSNVLIANGGFDGLVLLVASRGIQVEDAGSTALFHVQAGEEWERCVRQAADANYAGIECMAGIPGTAGGTPVQNVGAYGQEVAQVVTQVRAYDLRASRMVDLSGAECGFAYRRSRFNTVDRNRFIVTRVSYRLAAGGSPTLKYADLKREFPPGSAPTLAEVAGAVRRIRRDKGMLLVEGDPDCRSAGSFFKNPIVDEDHANRIEFLSGKEMPRFASGAPGRVKLSAAWLIEQAGFSKGFAMGAAAISSRHALALINRGGATASEILALAAHIREQVEKQFGVVLQPEPVFVGF